MPENFRPEFLFAACQHGAEAALKQDVSIRAPQLRPAFSRPGFVTFKLPEAAPDSPPSKPADLIPIPSAFARTSGISLGSVKGTHLHELSAQVWQLPALQQFINADNRLSGLHVWQRDERTPGDHGFEPGETAFAAEAETALRTASTLEAIKPLDPAAPASPTPRNRWLLDVALVEPNQWNVGAHVNSSRTASWVGGVPVIDLPDHAVSRAYLKMAEALAWAALPMSRGEAIVELGCAPGGASQALLDAGLTVVGVDPAEVAPEVLEDSRFTHVRARTHEVPRKIYKNVRWLAADMNVAPDYTLDAVEAAVTHPGATIRGMILTLKLADWKLAERIPEFVARVHGWGYRDVRLRQLAFNRQEICLAALRSRAQRRILRTSGRRRAPSN
jgi:23S rRNA (cytidine2498-2'-O)-methyltransferase